MGKKVGFIGLGLMGNPMAKNIVKSGYDLTVFNRTVEKTLELKELGANVVHSPKELAEKTNVIVTMVTDGDSLDQIIYGPQGIIEADNKDLTIIDMSTIGLTKSLQLSQRLLKNNVRFIDAPVTGSVPFAEKGELTIFGGGNLEVFENIKDILSVLGKKIVYVGPSGSGQAIKLINNFIIASINESLSEGLILAEKIGLTKDKFAEALLATSNLAPSLQGNMQNYINGSFPVYFTLKNLTKDLRLAREEMQRLGLNLPILTHIENLFQSANMEEKLSAGSFAGILFYIESIN